ncbi:oxygenase MpaB family protein [Nocardioides speluncae]|uniref:oxygenase MpaB family protein n=1 Tax=Nocardioides speluncae TaxID=2670337 RepID=UPI000D693F89|nr:oxygenase MpaB family protein [Nocardioides speluncae]
MAHATLSSVPPSSAVDHPPVSVVDGAAESYLVDQTGHHPLVDHWVIRLAGKLLGSGDIRPTDAQRESFKQWKQAGDPLADALVARIKNGGGADLRQKFDLALREGIDAVPDAPQELVDLFRETETVPFWVDPAKLERGSRAYLSMGPDAARMFVMAMSGSYLAQDANDVVLRTGEFVEKAAKRSVETLGWTHDVTAPGSLYPGRSGYQAALRVRMTHAFMRSGIANRKDWPESQVPINQSTYIATPILFSFAAMWLGTAMGHFMTRKDREAIFHLWRYISYLVGVNANLTITDEHDAFRLTAIAIPQEVTIDDQTIHDGRMLSKALMDAYAETCGYDVRTVVGRIRLRLDMDMMSLIMNVGIGRAGAHALAYDRRNWLAAVPLVGSAAWNATQRAVAYSLPGGRRRFEDARFKQARDMLTHFQERLDADRTYNRAG